MLRLVTVATAKEGYFDYLVKSCKRHGIFLEVLGIGQKWQGLNWKIEMVLKYLDKIPGHELVCFVDAYDVVVTSNACEIMKRFWDMTREHNVHVIAGCENPLNPVTKWLARQVFGVCKEELLNSGTYIGQVMHLQEVLKSMQKVSNDPSTNDQTIMTQVCSMNPHMIHVDKKNELFLTLNASFSRVHIPVIHGEIVLPSGSRPCILHANGNTRIDHTLRDLGYDVPDTFVKYMDSWTQDALRKKIRQYIKEFLDVTWFWLLLLCILILFWIFFVYTS